MTIRVEDAPQRHRFEGFIDDRLAGFLDYRQQESDLITFTHAETLDGFGGLGVASAITGFALSAARERGLAIRPLCSFVAAYLDRHPEYADLTRR